MASLWSGRSLTTGRLWLASQRIEAGGVAEGVAAEAEDHAFGSRFEFFDAGFAAAAFQGHDLQQVFDFLGQRAEAVYQFGGHGFGFAVRGQGADAAIEAEADRQVGT